MKREGALTEGITFERRYDTLDKTAVFDLLKSLKSPCFESRLLKAAFPNISILSTNTLSLYQNHFVLFHHLYRLQDELYQDNLYLFIHCMRTFLIPYPEGGQCRHYDEYQGVFCREPCDEGTPYCPFHYEKIGGQALETMSIKYFYLDTDNFYGLDEETADLFIQGAWEVLRNYEEYQKSYAVLGISERSDIRTIKKRFRQLAMIHHPDRGGQSSEAFNEINRAYRFLMRVLPDI